MSEGSINSSATIKVLLFNLILWTPKPKYHRKFLPALWIAIAPPSNAGTAWTGLTQVDIVSSDEMFTEA